MKLVEKTFLNDNEKTQILKIWNNEYPMTLNFSDAVGFDAYLNSLSDTIHYIIENENNVILAWGCKFTRDNEKWFAIILDQKIQGKGKGTEILNAIKNNEIKLNAWVIDTENYKKLDGEMYKSPLPFYLKNSFNLCPEIRIENEKLSAVKITWEK
ncbi:MAG: hypothetical protein V4666_05650 [Bacteroidota bacterium]